MERQVYDPITRKLGLILGLAFLFPPFLIAGIFWGHGVPLPEPLHWFFLGLVIFCMLLWALLQVTQSVRVQIDAPVGKLIQSWSLCGRELRRAETNLSEFDRVSLHRAYRGGYIAALVGQKKEVLLSFSAKLETVREAAAQAVSASRLPLKDNL